MPQDGSPDRRCPRRVPLSVHDSTERQAGEYLAARVSDGPVEGEAFLVQLASAREAIELCLEVYQEESRPLPPSEEDPRQTIKEVIPVRFARV